MGDFLFQWNQAWGGWPLFLGLTLGEFIVGVAVLYFYTKDE